MNLVFIHGWGQNKHSWLDLQTALSDSHDSLSLELPGHGEACWYNNAFALDALVDAYSAASADECILIGWSLGGMLAQRWAQRFPDQVKKLALISSTPSYVTREHWPHGTPPDMLAGFTQQIAADPLGGLKRFNDLMCEGEADIRAARRQLRALSDHSPAPQPAALIDGLHFLAETDLRDIRLAQPMLLLHGEGDIITPIGASQWLSEHHAHAQLAPIPACGHAPHLTHLPAVLAVLKPFLHE